MAGVLTVESREAKQLSAASLGQQVRDFDTDGLADRTESVLGTSPDHADSDRDGFHDLEELARQSDPLDRASLPAASPLGIGMFAHTHDGVLVLQTAVYVAGSDFRSLSFELGVVVRGQPLTVSPRTYASTSRLSAYPAPRDAADTLVVLETPVPESIVERYGQLSLYAIVRDDAPNGRGAVIDLVNVVHQGSSSMQVDTAPKRVASQTGRGIIYRPLSGEGSAPGTTSPGQICLQNLTPVGTKGSNIQYEVDQASCEDFDSYCNSSDCAAKVGNMVEFPDPGRLLGG